MLKKILKELIGGFIGILLGAIVLFTLIKLGLSPF